MRGGCTLSARLPLSRSTPSGGSHGLARHVSALAALTFVASSFVMLAAGKPPAGSALGAGTVFLPNPVADLGDQTLTDQKDANYPSLTAAYHDVVLTNLDGSGFLAGDWAQVVSETGDPAYSPSNEFRYRRDDDRFEQVMAYYWITEAQKYIQSLGFGTSRRPVNRKPQHVRINQWGVDNSFATTHKDELRFGKGGVDDAEDAEVILHEYGHAIHFSQGFAFASAEAGAISEGFGDYWAVTVGSVVAPTSDPACVADWDAVSYTVVGAALPEARRHEPALPGRSERRCASRRPDLVACSVGHQAGGRERQGRYADSRSAVRLRGDDDARTGLDDRGGGGRPLRAERRVEGPHRVREPRPAVEPLRRPRAGFPVPFRAACTGKQSDLRDN